MSDQPEPEAPGSRWWRYATEDLDTAQRLAGEDTFPRWVCVMAQQAAEKAIKTLLIQQGIDFPRSARSQARIDTAAAVDPAEEFGA